MNRLIVFRSMLAGLLVLFLSQANGKSFSAPVVYSDNYINVRSSVVASEEATFHIGDVLYLLIYLEYDPGRVRVVNLDETLLRDSWVDTPWIVPKGQPDIIPSRTENGLNRLEAWYAFQIVACPDTAVRCPGGKLYTLEDVSLGVELMDDDGRVVSNSDITFQPSPGFVGLASALTVINGRVESFNFYFPNRAFGSPVAEEVNPAPSLALFIIGLLMIGGMVVAPTAREWIRHRVPTGAGILGHRWERVLDRLQEDNLKNEEFWEGIRVAITWYCHDEFNINTMPWNNGGQQTTGVEVLDRLQALYRQAMTSPPMEQSERRKTTMHLTELLKGG